MTRTSAIFLVGMMGVGKSTVGAELAARLGRVFLDSDREIERKAGRTIPEIFETDGEATFRRLEAEAIEDASMDGIVIALGGGAVATPGAIERLIEAGEVVFLKADPSILIDRIGDAASRPMLAELDRDGRVQKLTALLEERLPFYIQARIHVDATGTTEQVVNRIIEALAID